MTAWDRVNRLELDLAEAEAKLRRLEAIQRDPAIAPIKTAAVLLISSLQDRLEVVEGERDRAREVAVALESEVARLEDALRLVGVAPVPAYLVGGDNG